MTKITILGEEPQKKELKQIEFTRNLCDTYISEKSLTPPHQWDFIELICKNYANSKEDLMFAHDGNRENGCLYFGHFNDGVV